MPMQEIFCGLTVSNDGRTKLPIADKPRNIMPVRHPACSNYRSEERLAGTAEVRLAPILIALAFIRIAEFADGETPKVRKNETYRRDRDSGAARAIQNDDIACCTTG